MHGNVKYFIGVPLICHTLGHFPSLLELLYQKS